MQSPMSVGQKDGGTHSQGAAVVVVVVVVPASHGLIVVVVVVPAEVVVVVVVVVVFVQLSWSISQVIPSLEIHLHLPEQFSGADGSPVVVVAEPATVPRSTI